MKSEEHWDLSGAEGNAVVLARGLSSSLPLHTATRVNRIKGTFALGRHVARDSITMPWSQAKEKVTQAHGPPLRHSHPHVMGEGRRDKLGDTGAQSEDKSEAPSLL
ncbi:hypothetical protein EYF80_004618 [Liparis tanakae]|uniref:Uncharacterized protein n=1 Tax=Liparis tanakae TaxID=230148 RepID=A0A4Z2J6J0_9TELE|nr:hypothetical protein EYF80_004618 [Liparis tanakae]